MGAARLSLVLVLGTAVPLYAQRCDHCTKDGIEMPISLAAGTVRTPEFPAKNDYYNIVIDVREPLRRPVIC
jgi:hypothetical protein